MTRLRESPEFVRFWSASTISDFGTYVTTLALQVLVVVNLHASATEVGIVNAARWLPYLMIGLLAGVLADRYRRRPMLVGADLGRGVVLGLIPLLWLLDVLTIPMLVGLLLVVGALSVLNDAAHQSFLLRLVAPAALTHANARLEQSMAVAQSTGPVLSGGLIAALGAPLAIVVDAASFLASGAILATLRTAEPPASPARRHLLSELREGLHYVYRHPMLAPYALATHVWFLCNAALTTAFVSLCAARHWAHPAHPRPGVRTRGSGRCPRQPVRRPGDPPARCRAGRHPRPLPHTGVILLGSTGIRRLRRPGRRPARRHHRHPPHPLARHRLPRRGATYLAQSRYRHAGRPASS